MARGASVRLTVTIELENVDPAGAPPVPGPELNEAVVAALLDESPEIRDEEEEYVITNVTVA